MVGAFFLLIGQLAAAACAPACLPAAGENPQARPSTLTLSAAVTQAKTASPRRRGIAHLAAAAHEAARQTGRLPNPVADFRTENWSRSAGPTAPEVDVFAVVTQPFELGGKRAIRRQLAVAESQVAAMAVASLERELALEAVRAYVRALRARVLVETLLRYHESLTALVANVTRRVQEGYSAEADLLKFRTEAARVEGEIARAQLELERGLAALGVLMGTTVPIESSQLVEPPPVTVPTVAVDQIAAAVARHPDVAAATAAVERARQATAFERARRQPDAAVTGGYKRTAGLDTMVLGVSVAVPLFDRNNASVARAIGLERAAEADREALLLQLSTDAEAMLRASRTITIRANTVARDLLEPAEEVRRAARTAFREGTADVLKLIDAERVFADAHRVANDLRLDALVSTLEARLALGEETIP
jgi:cobalt-zinc-cadmium efflux system outer membrane protein